MTKSNKFSPEVRERAVRMVQEHRGEYPSLWAAIQSIASKIGCVPQTLNEWVVREGVTVARCTVERLMHKLGLCGAMCGKVVRTTVSDSKAPYRKSLT